MQDVNPGLEYEVFAGEPKHLGAEAAGSDHAPLLRLGQVCQAELTDHDSGDESPGHVTLHYDPNQDALCLNSMHGRLYESTQRCIQSHAYSP